MIDEYCVHDEARVPVTHIPDVVRQVKLLVYPDGRRFLDQFKFDILGTQWLNDSNSTDIGSLVVP